MYTSPFPSQCSRSALMSQPPSTKSKSYSLRFRNLINDRILGDRIFADSFFRGRFYYFL